MGIKRTPSGIQTTGSVLYIRSTKSGSTIFDKDYVRVPGLGSFTLPAETATTNETQMLDGSIASAGTKGVGTIPGSLGARNLGVAAQFLEAVSLSGASIRVRIVHAAELVGVLRLGAGSTIKSSAKAGNGSGEASGKSEISVLGSEGQEFVKSTLLEDYVVSVAATDLAAADTDLPEDNLSGSYVTYETVPAAFAANQWMSVFDVEEDGTKFFVAPGIIGSSNENAGVAVVTVQASKSRAVFVRNPGLRWTDIICTVSQFDGGDFQAGGVISGNVTFQPKVTVPAPTLYLSTEG